MWPSLASASIFVTLDFEMVVFGAPLPDLNAAAV
jgi:hypothetical protein